MTKTLKNEAWDDTFSKMWKTRIIPDYLQNVNIAGYSRTGKSTLIHKITKSERLTFHEEMPLEDLIGGLQLINGTTQWVDGPAVRALRQGRCLQIDELNAMPSECRTMVYALMDRPAAVTLPNGERVEAKPGYCVITTQNPPPNVLHHPIFDRIDCFLKADRLSRGLRDYLGADLADKAENVIGHNQPELDWERPPTVNAFIAFKTLKNAGISDEEAVFLLGFRGPAEADFLTIIATR
jgi:hypothetical protein